MRRHAIVIVLFVTALALFSEDSGQSCLGAVDRRKAAALEKLPATITVDNEGKITAVSVRLSRTNEIDLSQLGDLSELRELSIEGFGADDGCLAQVRRLTKLRSLRLAFTSITDAGLSNLKGLTQLESLNLDGSFRITDDGMRHLKGLGNLKTLSLTFTRVANAGIDDLRRAMPALDIQARYRGPATTAEKTGRENRQRGWVMGMVSSVRSSMRWKRATAQKVRQDWIGLAVTLEQSLKSDPQLLDAWRLQAWNLAYNIRAEFDDAKDRYFWVSQGLGVLVEGAETYDRRARLAWELHWFTGSTIFHSDDAVLFRRWFADDHELHDMLIRGFPREAVLGPNGKPDNLLVAEQWALKAEQLVTDNPDQIDNMVAPVILASSAPSCRIQYAAALEKDGFFGEIAAFAWNKAGRLWNEFGDREIAVTEPPLRLNGLIAAEADLKTAVEKLDAFQSGTLDRVRRSLLDRLPEEERLAWNMDAKKRDYDQHELSRRVAAKLKGSYVEAAGRVEDAHRTEALEIAKQAAQLHASVGRIRDYRHVVNYDYWARRCRTEKSPNTITARQHLWKAHWQLDNQRPDAEDAAIAEAKQLFEMGFHAWQDVLGEFPFLSRDESVREELAAAVALYRKSCLRGGRLPADFPLGSVLEEWSREDQ